MIEDLSGKNLFFVSRINPHISSHFFIIFSHIINFFFGEDEHGRNEDLVDAFLAGPHSSYSGFLSRRPEHNSLLLISSPILRSLMLKEKKSGHDSMKGKESSF